MERSREARRLNDLAEVIVQQPVNAWLTNRSFLPCNGSHRRHFVGLVLLGAMLATQFSVAADATGMNGEWVLDADVSENLKDTARKRNDALNVEWRNKRENKFSKDQHKAKGTNRFQNQLDATERMIGEDSRSLDWSGSVEVHRILESKSIKLYRARKIAILYDGKQKRLLKVNPSGRAYSVKGTEITDDEVGSSLTYFDDDYLVIETSPPVGGQLIERYHLDDSQNQMVQELSIEERPGGPTLEFARRFNRAE